MLGREHRILLVDRSPLYTFEPSLPWVMTGERTVPRITRDLRRLERRGIEFVTAEVMSLDVPGHRVHTPNRSLRYDYLVLALGVEYAAEDVPGLNKAWTFYHPDGAEGLRDELVRFQGGRIAICVPALPYKCPPGPFEGAFLLDSLLRNRGLRDESEITIYTPEKTPISSAGGEVGERVMALLAERSIGFTGGVNLKSVNQEKKLLNFSDSAPAAFELVVATPVHKAPYVLRESGLLGEDGWVPANPEQLNTSAEDVFAIGDCASVLRPNGEALPKSGVFAHGEAEVVARNITAEIGGRDPIWAFGGQGACFMETGGGKAAYIVGDYFADPPRIQMHGPSRFRHWTKLGFERVWLWRWF
jgi:sulfide:quinone oxidoreductase